MVDKSPIPPGAYVMTTAREVSGGKMLNELDTIFTNAGRSLQEQFEDGSSKAKAKITLSVVIEAEKDSDVAMIEYAIKLDAARRKRLSSAKFARGRLLNQSTGTEDGDPSQIPLFDGQARPVGVIDRETGEFVDPSAKDEDVAGKIGQKDQA